MLGNFFAFCVKPVAPKLNPRRELSLPESEELTMPDTATVFAEKAATDLLIRYDPPRPFLGLAGVIYRDDIAERVEALISRFSKLAAEVPHLGPQVALYHPQGRDPFGPDGEPFWLGRELTAQLDAPTGLQLNWTPSGDVAVLVHEGAYEHMLDTHFALHKAVAQRGRTLVGPNWERYGRQLKDPANLRTEVCYLLEQVSGSQ